MEDQLVSFETAKLAKEKKFNYPCRGKIECSHYHFIKNNIIPSNISTSNKEMFAPIKNWNIDIKTNRGQFDRYTSLPTQSLLQKWLREVHNIHFFILGTMPYYVGGGDLVEYYYNFDTYEKAFEKGLQEALKLI